MIPNLTKIVSEFAVGLEFNDLPTEVTDKAKLLLLDYIGYALAGSQDNPSKIVTRMLIEKGGKKESTIIAHNGKYPCFNAALANGVMGHCCEMDDTHRKTMMHPGDSILPAALAIAEMKHSNGKELLSAIIAAYEITLRIAEAIIISHYEKWHPTGTINTFGAAVAAGKLLYLDTAQTINALGLAGTQAAGMWTFLPEMAMSKDLNPGKAAMNGVLAALLASRGFTGGTQVLEAEKGFFRVYSQENIDLEKIVSTLGKNFKIMEVAHKPYSACRYIHSAIDATLKIVKEHEVYPDGIKEINVCLPSVPYEKLGKIQASGHYAARFNVPFQVAITIIGREKALDEVLRNPSEYSERKLRSKEVLTLMKKVRVNLAPTLDRDFPESWPAIVSIKKCGGEISTQRVDFPKGEPENPISRKDLTRKFKILASLALSEEQVEALLSKLTKIDESSDVSAIMEYTNPFKAKGVFPFCSVS